jgi:hypothetical protein
MRSPEHGRWGGEQDRGSHDDGANERGSGLDAHGDFPQETEYAAEHLSSKRAARRVTGKFDRASRVCRRRTPPPGQSQGRGGVTQGTLLGRR